MASRFEILQRLIRTWQAKDLEGVLAMLHDDIVWHYAAPALPPVKGKATARKLLTKFQGDMHEITWRIFAHAETGNRLFIEGVDEYRNAEGHRVATPYAGVLEFEGDLIIGWRDYVDLAVMADQQAGKPAKAHVEALLDRPTA